MKKTVVLILVAISILALSLTAYAAGTNSTPDSLKADVKAFKTELKDLNGQVKELTGQLTTLKKEIRSLVTADQKARNKGKLTAAKAYKEELTAVNAGLKSLKASYRQEVAALKAARKAKDIDAAKTELTKVIDLKKQIVEKANAQVAVLQQMEAALK